MPAGDFADQCSGGCREPWFRPKLPSTRISLGGNDACDHHGGPGIDGGRGVGAGGWRTERAFASAEPTAIGDNAADRRKSGGSAGSGRTSATDGKGFASR